MHQIVRRVLHHLDLFEHHLLLALDVTGVERRVEDQVGEHVDGAWEMLVDHFDVVAGALLGGERIELPAERVDLLGDLLGRPGRRALEQHVLDEMRNARVGGALVAGSTGEPGGKTHRADIGH